MPTMLKDRPMTQDLINASIKRFRKRFSENPRRKGVRAIRTIDPDYQDSHIASLNDVEQFLISELEAIAKA